MTAHAIQLQWQWPADRTPEQKLALRVSSVSPERTGWFGIRKSPSIGDSFPDATIVEGDVVEGPDALRGAGLRLRAPKMELGDAAAGDVAAIGLVGGGIAICFSVVPDDVARADLAGWLEAWTCE